MKKTKKIVLLELLNKMCVTLKIYLELDKANWILKFKPLEILDVISK